MLSTISLADIHHHTYLQNFFPMRSFKIYTHSNFQIYNTVLLTIVTRLYITSPGLTYFITGSLYLLIPSSHFA